MKGKPNRSKLEILFEILECIDVGMSKTHIIYEVFMSYNQLTRYIKEMIGLGLINENLEGRLITYTLTGKGVKLLELSRQLYDLLYNEEVKPRSHTKRILSKIFGR